MLSTVLVLLNVTGHGLTCDDYEKPNPCDLGKGDALEEEEECGVASSATANYPDLVPMEERGYEASAPGAAASVAASVASSPTAAVAGQKRSTTIQQDMESVFLIAVLLSTIIFLYLFPAE